jgi:TonB family protein
MAQLVGQHGEVVLHAVITETGEVESIEVIRAPRPELGLAAAAVEAVAGWRYDPGRYRGRPVRVALTVTVEFHLE